jgi:hypothetical protein
MERLLKIMARFLKPRSRYLINKSIFILLCLMLFSSLMIVTSQYFLKHPLVIADPIITWLIVGATILLIFIWKKATTYWEKVSDNYDKGDTGELKIQDILKQLPDDYIVIPDVQQAKGGNIDFVVVGPTGIFALEVKNFKGSAKIGFNGKSLTFDGKAYNKDPLKQAIRNAINLGQHLRTKLNQPYLQVIPVLVFAGHQILRFGLKPVKSNARVIRNEYLLDLLKQKGNLALGTTEVEHVSEEIKTSFLNH